MVQSPGLFFRFSSQLVRDSTLLSLSLLSTLSLLAMGNGNSRPKVDYPPGTYGTMYGQVPDEKRIDDLLVILLSNIARQPGNEQLHRTGWIMIFEAMCVTDLGLLRKRNVDVAFRVAYSPEQDLRTLRVKAGRQHVAEAEKQGGGGGDSGAQGSSVADGNHAKAVTSIESSATYKAFLDLHKTYRERTPCEPSQPR